MRLAQTLECKMHGSVYGSKIQCANNTPNTIHTTIHKFCDHSTHRALHYFQRQLESNRQKARTCPVKALNVAI